MPGLSTRHQATPSLTLLSPISQSTRASPYCVATVEALEEGAECREEGRGAGVAWRWSLLLREAGPEGLNHPPRATGSSAPNMAAPSVLVCSGSTAHHVTRALFPPVCSHSTSGPPAQEGHVTLRGPVT